MRDERTYPKACVRGPGQTSVVGAKELVIGMHPVRVRRTRREAVARDKTRETDGEKTWDEMRSREGDWTRRRHRALGACPSWLGRAVGL